MKTPVVAVILLGTDPHLSRGGIASVLPSYLSLLDHAKIPHRFVPTHSNDRFTGKFRHAGRAIPVLVKAIREYKSSGLTPIVHAFGGQWPSLLRKRVLLKIAHLAGARTVMHLHGAEIEGYTQTTFKRAGLIRVLSGVDLLLALTPHWGKLLKDLKIPGATIKLLPNPLSPELETHALEGRATRENPTRYEILSINRLIPGKGFEFLIDVLALLPESFHLTLAGTGELLESLEKRAQIKNCSHRIKFPGWVEGKQKLELYEQADIFCLFTQRDCMSTGLLEAMSHGLPIVALQYGPTEDLVPRSAGVFIDPDQDSLRTLQKAVVEIQELARNYDLRSEMSAAGKRSVLERFSSQAVIQQWLNIFEKLQIEGGLKGHARS